MRVVAYNGQNQARVRAVGEVYGRPLSGVFIVNDNSTLGTPIRRSVEGQTIELDHIYKVPAGDNATLNRWFKGKDGHRAIGPDWLFTYETTSSAGTPIPMGYPEPVLHPGDTIVVYEATSVISQPGVVQQFARGVSHCLIQPIINYFEEKGQNAATKAAKYSNLK